MRWVLGAAAVAGASTAVAAATVRAREKRSWDEADEDTLRAELRRRAEQAGVVDPWPPAAVSDGGAERANG
jgi:hypothetical protein